MSLFSKKQREEIPARAKDMVIKSETKVLPFYSLTINYGPAWVRNYATIDYKSERSTHKIEIEAETLSELLTKVIDQLDGTTQETPNGK
jgi:hypothetical protein